MATLTQLQAFRERLQEARFSGLRRARDSNGEEVEYRSDAELARAIAALDAEVSALIGWPILSVIFRTSKGL